MRDENGCIVLDGYDEFIGAYRRGRKEKLWLINKKDEKFLFKYGASNYEIFAELIAEELGKQCGIDMAEYNLGTYKGNIGVVSKSFLNQGDLIISMDKYIDSTQKILMENNINIDIRKNSIENIVVALGVVMQNVDVDKIMFQLMARWVFYGLIMESDKNSTNLSLIKNDSLSLSKDYDNSTMCRMNENINNFINNIRSDSDVYKMTDDIQQSLTFKNDDDPRFLVNFERFCEKYPYQSDAIMRMISNFNVDLAIENVEKRNGNIEIPWEVKYWLNKAIGLRYKDMLGIYNKTISKKDNGKIKKYK